MDVYESVNPIAIGTLVREIEEGKSVLPEFQRDFVWEPGATVGLLASVASGFPAGTILRVTVHENFFSTRPFADAPVLGIPHTYLVLDGQQRLTSLYQSMFGKGKYRYLLDMQKATTSDDWSEDEVITFKKAKPGVIKALDDLETLAKNRQVPLQVIHGRTGGFLSWILEAKDKLPAEEQNDFLLMANNLYNEKIKRFENYQFPVVTLSASTTPSALCTIFETLNNTGVKLTVFELLTARFAKYKINLRDLWDKAKSDHPEFELFGVDPTSLLQALSLNLSGSCQKKAILKLDKDDLEMNWDKIVEGMAYGIEILRQDCHVPTAKWMPTPSMFAPLGAIASICDRKGVTASQHRALVRCWLWNSIFGRRYEAAANTRAERDVADMVAWFKGGDVPLAIEQFRLDEEELREASRASSPVYKGVICMILSNGARDFHDGSVIAASLVATNEVDDHHVFPDSFLEKSKNVANKALRNCVLNRTLIDRTTNQKISDRAPSDYVLEMKNGVKDFDGLFESHFLNGEVQNALLADDYEAFLTARSKLIVAQIEKVTKPPKF